MTLRFRGVLGPSSGSDARARNNRTGRERVVRAGRECESSRVASDDRLRLTDRRLKRNFAEGREVSTVAEFGWAGKKKRELLRLDEKRFGALLSKDKGIPHQQSLSRCGLAVALLRAKSNAYEDRVPLMD